MTLPQMSAQAANLLRAVIVDHEEYQSVVKRAAQIAKRRGNERILEADARTALWERERKVTCRNKAR